jgi:hypothetical protein
MQLAVLFSFVASQKHTDSVASEKHGCNRVGLHYARFWDIFADLDLLCWKIFLKIAISPNFCESWARAF